MASKPRRQRNSIGLPIQLGPSSLTSIFRPKKTEEPPRDRPDLYASLTDLRPVRRKVQLVSHPGQVRQRRHLHLPDDLTAVDFYSNLADADVVRDLLVEARPATTKAITSRSRRVSVSKRARSAANAFSLSNQARSRARPSWIASSRS
jgi:hypothetical protein